MAHTKYHGTGYQVGRAAPIYRTIDDVKEATMHKAKRMIEKLASIVRMYE